MIIKLTTATPLHIGNGRSLSPYTDYVVGDDGKVYLIDSQKLNEHLEASGDEAIDEFVIQIMGSQRSTEVYSLKKFLKKYKINYKEIAKFTWETSAPIQNETIQETIKTASKAYIPGSSIKGTIRTALLYFHRKEENYRREDARKDIFGGRGERKSPNGEDIFGRYNHDVLKHLHVSDTTPLPSDEAGLVKTVRFNLAQKETSVPVTKEVIPESKTLQFCLQSKAVDRHNLPSKFKYLYRNENYIGERKIMSIVNQFYLQLLEEEISVLKQLGTGQTGPLLNLYERLHKAAEKYDSEKNGAVIRLGSGKTFLDNTIISLFSHEDRSKLLKEMKMGGGRLFPKTRAVIDSIALYDSVLGWAYLDPI